MQVVFNWGFFIVGVVIGIIAAIIPAWRTDGVLRIDHSNPEKDIYRFDIDNLDALGNKNRVVLKVDSHADLSQK